MKKTILFLAILFSMVGAEELWNIGLGYDHTLALPDVTLGFKYEKMLGINMGYFLGMDMNFPVPEVKKFNFDNFAILYFRYFLAGGMLNIDFDITKNYSLYTKTTGYACAGFIFGEKWLMQPMVYYRDESRWKFSLSLNYYIEM